MEASTATITDTHRQTIWETVMGILALADQESIKADLPFGMWYWPLVAVEAGRNQ